MRTGRSPKMETSDSPRYSVGIDPGLEEAGIVLVEHGATRDTVIEYGLVRSNSGPSIPTVFRAQAAASRLIEQLMNWVDRHQIVELAVGLEYPIYNRNVVGFGKQMASIQAIEAALVAHVAPMLAAMTIATPSPTESKHLATGSGAASKGEVFTASPFDKMALDGLPEHSQQTLSDAWSHSLSARKGCERRFDAKMLPWPSPRPAGGIE
jgi:Holliday junction resolvasome RuvABC endonuclease subunit